MKLEQFVMLDGYAQGLMAAAVKMQAEVKEMFARGQQATADADEEQDVPSEHDRFDALIESARTMDTMTDFEAIKQRQGIH